MLKCAYHSSVLCIYKRGVVAAALSKQLATVGRTVCFLYWVLVRELSFSTDFRQLYFVPK